MAIIKCPECGEPVSSTTNRCVHCGYEFTVCPECGTVLQGKVSVCKNCGYEIKNHLLHKTSNLSDKNKFNTEDYMDDNLQTVFYTVTKPASVIKNIRIFVILISFIIGAGLLILGFVELLNWKPQVLAATLENNDNVGKINSLFAWSIVFFIAGVLFDWFSMHGLIYYFGKWIKVNQVDYISYLKYNSAKPEIDKKINGFDATAQASCVAYSKKMQNLVLTRLILITSTLILSGIFLFKAFDSNVQAYITYKMASSISSREAVFKFDYVYVIVCGVFYAVQVIINKCVIQGMYRSQVDRWVEDALLK